MGALLDWERRFDVRLFIIAAALAGTAAALPSAAQADRIDSWRELEYKRQECARKLDRADSRREYNNRLAKCRRQIAEARHRLERQRYSRWEGRDGDWGRSGPDRDYRRHENGWYRSGDWD
jgi:hypothetical protein